MRRGLTTACIALGLLGGCGGSGATTSNIIAEPPPATFQGPPEEQVALTVNAFYKAWTAGDGEQACSFLSPRGQRIALEMIPQLHGLTTSVEATNCPDAIAQSAEGVAGPVGQKVAPGQVTVHGDNATVQSKFRGAIPLRRIGGAWLLEIPLFVD
jgi:hypothetical protein